MSSSEYSRQGSVSPLEPVLSTIWLQKRFDHLNDFFAAGEAMGFRQFEPGVVVTPAMLEGAVSGQQLIPSVHAPCPNIRHASGQSAAGLFASTDETERTWAVSKSLEEVVPYARAASIKLGLEVRYYYCEMPSLQEMHTLLADSESVYYWHDTGHAQSLEKLGFTPHEEWLRAFGPRTLGVHFHDIRGFRDHLIPGTGEIDFETVAFYLPEEAIRTCEFDYPFSTEEVIAGVEFLRKMGCLGRQKEGVPGTR